MYKQSQVYLPFCPAMALAARSINQPYLAHSLVPALVVTFCKVENTKKEKSEGFDK